MTNLRQEARGEPCMIRSAVCNFDPLTTVLCHYRAIGMSGLGMKSPDIVAAWGCSACHAYVDTDRSIEAKYVHLLGVVRTQAELIRRGLIKW